MARRRSRSVGDIIFSISGRYGTIFGETVGEEEDRDEDGSNLGWKGKWRGTWRRSVRDVWLEPTQRGVKGCIERWWWRWWSLVGLPAGLVSFFLIFLEKRRR